MMRLECLEHPNMIALSTLHEIEGHYTRTKDEDYETDPIKIMLSKKHFLDTMLCEAAKLNSSGCNFYIPKYGNETAVYIMSSTDIETWQNTLKSISDIDQIKKSIGEKFWEKDYILPFEGADCQDSSIIIDLPNLEELKKYLSKRTSTTYVIKRIKEDLPIEIPLDDFCDEINDNMDTYEDDIKKMKYEDILMRELQIGDVEYSRLSCKVRQVITSCDILMEQKSLEHVIQRILSIGIAWKNDLVMALATKVLSVLFPTQPNGSFLVIPEDIENVTRCHIGCRQWGSHYWGLGLALERVMKLNVYWQDFNELNSSDISNPSNYVTSFECTMNQGFALSCSKDEDSSTFLFSSESDKCDELSLETDALQGYLRLKIFPSEHEQTSQRPKQDDLTHLSESSKRLSLEKVVQDLVHDKVQDEQKLAHTFQTVVAWGNNLCNHLGIELNDDGTKKEVSPHPECISRNFLLGIETVKMIDCSSCHTLLLSNLGNVYSCGEGSYGQLGHDTLDSSFTFRLIEWFVKRDGTQNRIEVVQISAGGDESISHSTAIDVDGYLYTWGKAIVCGHIEKLDSKVNSRIQEASITLPKRVEVFKDQRVLQVSCGCGFTIARVTGRSQEANIQDNYVQVYSWGINTRGRLGIGNLEQKFQRIPKYQMIPTLISTLTDEYITEVKAGIMHAIAVNTKGEVFCWGSNSKGECSVVDIDDNLLANIEKQRFHDRYDGMKQTTYPSLWDDIWTPRKLDFFGATKVCTAQSVSAGGHQSAVVDTSGRLYTWGGGGQGYYCLGHGHTTNNRLPTYNSYDKKYREKLVISGCASVPHWAIPRLVESLASENITKVSLGNYHGAALSSTGSVHLWGDPSAVSTKSYVDDPYSNIQYSKEIQNVKESIPIVPNVKYLSKLAGGRVADISCGNGSTFCILTGYRIQTALNKLYGDCHIYSVRSDEYYAEDDSINGYEIGGIDCVVIVGGKRMYCHKLVLAQRSSVLKAIITEALPQDMSSIFEIVLPDIPYTVMSDIIKFIYTGTITKTDLRNYFDVKCLYETAGKLKIPSLVQICENILKYYHDFTTELPNDSLVSQENNDTVVIDIGNALNDPKLADIKILTDDEIDIMAHACILKNTSTYFRSIISVNQRRSPILEIKLPGSHSSIIRMLLYLYTGIVSEISSEQDLVDDLKNAHKYELWDMKSQCESALSVIISNAPDILLLSQQVQSKRLETEALITIAHNLKSYYSCKDSKEKLLFILSQCSYNVRDELFERIKEVKGPESIIPEMHRCYAQSCIEKGRHRQSRMKEKLEAELIGKFSFKRMKMSTILRGVLIGLGYLFLLNFANIQKLIPIINLVALSVGFMQLYNSLK